MKCPECKAENPETTKFCRKCGSELLLACPQCGAAILPDDDFCGKCGHTLSVNISAKAADPNDFVLPIASGERKQVSVLFSDLSGYTAMTERLDPEEVREIMDRVFGKIRQVVDKYDGFIEKFVGDSAMAVFGVPSAHEDDPIRAIRAAMEIHAQVEGLSPEVEGKIGQALSMHSGINTGLVVTGQVDRDKGTHGLIGDTINLASRLEGLAKSGQVLVGENTYNLTKSHFSFERMEPTKVKGKAEPLPVFKLLSSKEEPPAVHRLQGVRAELIGRQKEMELLNRAVEKLKNGQGSIICIVGDAGTGKSRLVRDFKTTLNLKEIQWREGHAYPYTQNMPYYPLINLLTHAFRIQEGDNPETIRGKIEAGIKTLLWDRPEIIPYIGGLFSLSYPEIDDVSPEFLRAKLQEATLEILEALARSGPTVLWFEDLHWSDTSYIDLLHLMLTRTNRPVVFILAYRPVFNLFPEGPPDKLNWPYHEIVLQDLSRVDSQEMLKSLLHSEDLPAGLEDFIRDKVEGNPFYLEEVVNSLIETGTLMRENGGWSLTSPITGLDIPPTIQGVLTARLDRLEREAKRILQEASVIGRAFFYEVLTRITQLNLPVDRYLTGLESLDLIRTRTREPDLEYIFKHALTQEVVYNGLLKKERHAIHERIGEVMEQLFADRIPEFYDALAYHFNKGLSHDKAAEYLIKSGEKSYKTLSNQEAKQYYQQAYDLLTAKPEKSHHDKALMMDLLFNWALLLYDFGDFNTLLDLFSSHESMAESVDDKPIRGKFKAWLGFAYYAKGQPLTGVQYLDQALEIGREQNDPKLTAYAYTWLAWCHWELGSADKTIAFGEQGHKLAKQFSPHQYLDFKPLAALGNQYVWEGRWKELKSIGSRLLEQGKKTSNPRCFFTGHQYLGFAYSILGQSAEASDNLQKSIQATSDVPFYRYWAKAIFSMSYAMDGQMENAGRLMAEVMEFTTAGGGRALGDYTLPNYGIALFAQGRMNEGLTMLKEAAEMGIKGQRKRLLVVVEFYLGNIFSQLAAPNQPIGFSTLMKNLGFLIKNLPGASKKAERQFHKAIKLAEETKSYLYAGQSWLELGRMFKAKKKKEKAEDCLEEAIKVFKMLDNEFYLTQAKETLASLR